MWLDMVSNPFSITKANDLTDVQINTLWVDVQGEESRSTLFDAGKFASPMPTFILGGKGSGKTHLMRYASFALQKMRFDDRSMPIVDGLRGDGYLGVYVRCSGLDTGRFQGKGQSEDAWAEIFSYYLELWLGQSLLNIVSQISEIAGLSDIEARLCSSVGELFDADPPDTETLSALCADLGSRRKRLDFEVNNAAFTGKLSPGIALTRGRLIFGLPKIIAELIPELKNIQFCYQLDEFENLSLSQQVHVNTLVRERQKPATFKIGARQFGIRSYRTLSAEEENLRDSEYDELRLDLRYRADTKRYVDLLNRLIRRRLAEFQTNASSTEISRDLKDWFEEPDLDWNSDFFRNLVGDSASLDRTYFQRLRQQLSEGFRLSSAPGVSSTEDVRWILSALSCPEYPLLEKLNLLVFYSEWAKPRVKLNAAAKAIHEQCQAYMAGRRSDAYAQKLKRYKADLVAQMLRENGQRQLYTGLDTFIRMSEGQPRALITLLKHTYDWADFQGEHPFVQGRISLLAQSKGAFSSADWFYNSMMKAGADGRDILIAIDRLSQLFRINRFSDKVRECSLIGFSGSLIQVSERAATVLANAVDRSFLVDIEGGQQERNSEQVTKKLQLNRMLVPRWSLGTGRRGIIPLKHNELEAIFNPDAEAEFQILASQWEARASAPLFGQKRKRAPHWLDDGEGDLSGQTDLFDR